MVDTLFQTFNLTKQSGILDQTMDDIIFLLQPM